MKKLLLILVLIFVSITSFSQSESEQQTNSKTLDFLAKDGLFVKKESYYLKKINEIECVVVIFTDIVNNLKIGGIDLKAEYSTSYSKITVTVTLDFDEIDACIQSMEYIHKNFLHIEQDTHTKVEYKTRNFSVAAYYYDKKQSWGTFAYIGDAKRELSYTELGRFIEVLIQAKNMITEKITQ